MKYTARFTLSTAFFLLCACTVFQAKQPEQANHEAQRKVLAVPVGKNWQVIEEPPVLSNERNETPPFQQERSVQPPGTQPVPPAEQRRIETPR